MVGSSLIVYGWRSRNRDVEAQTISSGLIKYTVVEIICSIVEMDVRGQEMSIASVGDRRVRKVHACREDFAPAESRRVFERRRLCELNSRSCGLLFQKRKYWPSDSRRITVVTWNSVVNIVHDSPVQEIGMGYGVLVTLGLVVDVVAYLTIVAIQKMINT
jgi:hypothetical protein